MVWGRPFLKGHPKTGGRTKGTPNRKTVEKRLAEEQARKLRMPVWRRGFRHHVTSRLIGRGSRITSNIYSKGRDRDPILHSSHAGRIFPGRM
jgi:hypothetical protein